VQSISRGELKNKMEANDRLKIIEVLPQDAFRNFHIPGAMNIPIGDEDFDEKIQKAADKNEEVVVYCKDSDCDASPKAAKRMEQLGFNIVYDYEAGKDDWKEAGLPTEG